MSDWNKNERYLDVFYILNEDEKLNKNKEIVKFGERIKKIYFEYLYNNDFRIFAKYDISKYSDYKAINKNFRWEAISLQQAFKDNFKSKSAIRFRKDLVSTFAIKLKDFYNNNYYCYFCINKKEYEERKEEYLIEFENYFISKVEEAIKNKEGNNNE